MDIPGGYAEMTIKVLGACCRKSKETFENTKLAIQQLGLEATVENIGDMAEIASYGVMTTPALVIDDQVVSFGKFLSKDDAVKIISKIAGQ
jgi:small redox-active disulfide protein 2